MSTFRAESILALAFSMACSNPGETTAPGGIGAFSVEITSISCNYSHMDGFRNKYYFIDYAGTATGKVGMKLQLSSPDFASGTKYTSTCGGWTSFSWGGGSPGCERKTGQPQTVSWSARSDLWIENQTHRQEASLWHPESGSLGKVIRSIRCLGGQTP